MRKMATTPRYFHHSVLAIIGVLAWMLVRPQPVWAAQGVTQLEMFPLFMGMFGGLALFLYGMDMMSDAMKTVAGLRMRDILEKLTANRLTGFFTGVVYPTYGKIISERSYFPAAFSAQLGLKDLTLTEKAATEVGAALPLASALHHLFVGAVSRRDLKEGDWSVIAEVIRDLQPL